MQRRVLIVDDNHDAAAFIIALTGWGREPDKQRAADAGFDTHLTKPADPRAIEQLLGQQSLRA